VGIHLSLLIQLSITLFEEVIKKMKQHPWFSVYSLCEDHFCEIYMYQELLKILGQSLKPNVHLGVHL